MASSDRFALTGCPQYGHRTFSCFTFSIFTASKHLSHYLLQSSHLTVIVLFRHIIGLMFPPCIVNSALIHREMLDHFLIRLGSDGYYTPQSGIRGQPGQQRLKLIPGYCLKFFCSDPKPVLREEAGNDQVPVLKQVVVRVSALPMCLYLLKWRLPPLLPR